jgi:hypothetical protein
VLFFSYDFVHRRLAAKVETELLLSLDLFFENEEITRDANSTACAVSLEKKISLNARKFPRGRQACRLQNLKTMQTTRLPLQEETELTET